MFEWMYAFAYAFLEIFLSGCLSMCAYVFVVILLFCMVTQFQGCGWAQGCPWLSLLIICQLLRQLRRGQYMSSEEMEGVLVLSNTHTCTEWLCPTGTPVVFNVEPGPQVIGRIRHQSHNLWHHSLAYTCKHIYTKFNIAVKADILKYIHIDRFAYMHFYMPEMRRQRQ